MNTRSPRSVDENDAVVYFDDVKMPWERVFVYRDTDMCRAQFHDTPSHVFQNYQSQIRLSVKTRFLAGLARKLADVIGTTNMPQVRDQLGRIAAQAAMVEFMMHGMEARRLQRKDISRPTAISCIRRRS